MQRTQRRTSLEQRERAAAKHRKWNEVRPWMLICPSCEHQGIVNVTLRRLKAANIKCSACGAYLWRND